MVDNEDITKFQSRIEQLKTKLNFLKNETFSQAPSGTRYKVFTSKNYVVRFRDENPNLLKRETEFLQKLNYPLIPKVVWTGIVKKYPAMIENRLPGQTLDAVWRKLPTENQNQIIRDIIQFIGYLQNQRNKYIYSVNTGEKYEFFFDYLADGLKEKASTIEKYTQVEKVLKDILTIIQNPEAQYIFQQTKITLVHGDLIIHNLLTDGKCLTGVLDWEFALWGDPDYDLARLWYYQECAKAYEKQGADEIYEADFMDKLVPAIKNTNLIEDKKIFEKKYQIIKAYFRLNALFWAVKSDNPDSNIQELIEQ